MTLRLSTLLILLLFGLLPIQNAMAFVEVGGTIASDTTWTAADTILVTERISISGTAVLTVQSGTVVLFNPAANIIVNGGLKAAGTAEAPIHFTSAADIPGGNPQVTDWGGIRVNGTATCRLEYCRIRFAIYCVQTYDVPAEFHHCVVENFYLHGIYIYGDSDVQQVVLIEDCTIQQTAPGAIGTGLGIYIYKTGAAEIRRSTIQNCSQGIEIFGLKSYQPLFTIENCQIEDNSANGVYIHTGT